MSLSTSEWNPQVAQVRTVDIEWLLVDLKPLNKWIHDSGRVILFGNARHPMLVNYIVGLLSSLIVDIRS